MAPDCKQKRKNRLMESVKKFAHEVKTEYTKIFMRKLFEVCKNRLQINMILHV